MPPSPDEAARKLAYQKPADSAYAQRIRERDKPTWTNSFCATRQDLLGVAWLRRPPGTPSEDLVQEAFLSALKSAGSFRGDGSFYSWMYKILLCRCGDAWRKLNKQAKLTDSDVDAIDPHEANNEDIIADIVAQNILFVQLNGTKVFTDHQVKALQYILCNPGKPKKISQKERDLFYASKYGVEKENVTEEEYPNNKCSDEKHQVKKKFDNWMEQMNKQKQATTNLPLHPKDKPHDEFLTLPHPLPQSLPKKFC